MPTFLLLSPKPGRNTMIFTGSSAVASALLAALKWRLLLEVEGSVSPPPASADLGKLSLLIPPAAVEVR